MKMCPNCGDQCSDNDKFCSTCGIVLPENQVKAAPESPAEKPVEQKEKTVTRCILGVIFAGIYILVSGVFWIISAIEIFFSKDYPAKWILFLIGLICLPVALIVSIVGTAQAKARKNKKSKKLGTLGIWGTGGGFMGNVVLLVLLVVALISVATEYEYKDVRRGDFNLRLKSRDNTQAKATCYYWNGEKNRNTIYADYADGIKIVCLDDFDVKVEEDRDYYTSVNYYKYAEQAANPLYPDYEETYCGLGPGSVIHHSNIIFYVEISKDVKDISIRDHSKQVKVAYYIDRYRPADLAVVNDDGSVTFYKYFYYFTVDPDNTKYYAEDGVLYEKKTGEKVNANYYDKNDAYIEDTFVFKPEEAAPPEEEPDPEPTGTQKNTVTYGTGSERINLWSYSEEVPKMVGQYIKRNPEFGEKYTVECTIIYTDGGAYKTALDVALVSGGDNAPDIYACESGFVYRFTQGEMAKYAAPYKDLGINVDRKIKEAEIAKYSVDVGTRDGKVVALSYQSTAGVMIYNSEIAKDVFGTDDPAEIEKITGAGTGDWDKFLEASEKLKAKGYAAVSGPSDLWGVCEKSADKGWVIDGKLNIDPKRENYLDLAKTIKDNGYSNNTRQWYETWYQDFAGKGEKKVFAFFGPAWFINYVMAGNSGGFKIGEGTYGQWKVCAPPVGFFWGGTWLLANKNANNKEGVAELLEWITLDTSDTGLQYLWANGLIDWDNDPNTTTQKDAVTSSVVMAKSDGTLDFCGKQNIFPAFIEGNRYASGKALSEYDEIINRYYEEAANKYMEGGLNREEAIEKFRKDVEDNIAF